jgi:lysozyme
MVGPVQRRPGRKTGITAAVFAGGLALAVPMVAKHEGVWLVAKPDTLAHGIPTVCYGETEGVKVGDRYTPTQCEDMLEKKLVRYANSAAACIYVPVSAKMFSTFIDLNYNIGEDAFCRSTAAKRTNDLDYEGGCEAMRAWTNAGGQFRQGLLNRRLDEIAVCREGIKEIER